MDNFGTHTAHDEYLFKIIIIGDPSTGKSSLLKRYCENSFNEKYKCTIGVDFQIKVLKFQNKVVKLQLWDTAGQERFKVMTKSYYRGAKGCCIVYDVTRRSSFSNVETWADQYLQNNTQPNSQIIAIVGNKSDLDDEREISPNEGANLAQRLGCLFFECSAKIGGEAIFQIFDTLTSKILEQAVEEEENRAKNPLPEKRPERKFTVTKKQNQKIVNKGKCCS